MDTSGVFQKVAGRLSKNQVDSLCRLTGFDSEKIGGMSDNELEKVYDTLCSIEVDETVKAGERELSDRGKAASELVTLFGNAIAEENGYFEEWDL
jgi:hypothetical protein